MKDFCSFLKEKCTEECVSFTYEDEKEEIFLRRENNGGVSRVNVYRYQYCNHFKVRLSDKSLTKSYREWCQISAGQVKTKYLGEYDGDIFKPQESSTQTCTTGCFIATVAYGSPLTKELDALRAFRDLHLSGVIGRQFVKVYYFLSPSLANQLSKSPRGRQIVRKFLNLIVKRLKHNDK